MRLPIPRRNYAARCTRDNRNFQLFEGELAGPLRAKLTLLCLVWVQSFSLVLQHLAGASIHADLESLALALDVKRIAKASASTLFLKLLIGDPTGTRRKCRGARLRKRDLRQRQEIRAGKAARIGSKRASRTQGDCRSETKELTHHTLHKGRNACR